MRLGGANSAVPSIAESTSYATGRQRRLGGNTSGTRFNPQPARFSRAKATPFARVCNYALDVLAESAPRGDFQPINKGYH